MRQKAAPRPRSSGGRSVPVVLLLIAQLACAQVEAGRKPSSNESEQAGKSTRGTTSNAAESAEAVVLSLGEETTVGDVTLTWTEVEDSRCPIDVQCIWEGRVVVTLEVSVGDEDPETVRLTNHPDGLREEGDSDLVERLQLVDVEPYPHSEHPTERSDYRATIRIRKSS